MATLALKVKINFHPKRWLPSTGLHGVTTQKTTTDAFTVVTTSNIIYLTSMARQH
jgi:hypothetical protein